MSGSTAERSISGLPSAPAALGTGRKTIETLPDGNRHVVYTNYLGQVMLKTLVRMSAGQETGDKWHEYFQYDTAGRRTLIANSSAVQNINEGTAGLVTIKSSDGLIRLYDYYGASPPAGGAPGMGGGMGGMGGMGK